MARDDQPRARDDHPRRPFAGRSCLACTSIDGKGGTSPPHPRLELVRRRHEAAAGSVPAGQLLFRCRTCETEVSWRGGPGAIAWAAHLRGVAAADVPPAAAGAAHAVCRLDR